MITSIREFRESVMQSRQMPELFYHGSNQLFDNFNKEKMGQNFKQSTLGFYFSQYLKPLPYGSTAKEYAEEMVRRYGGKPYIYTCKLNFKNPLIIDTHDWEEGSAHYVDRHRDELKHMIKDHDAILAYDQSEPEQKYMDITAIVFYASQIQIINVREVNSDDKKNDY